MSNTNVISVLPGTGAAALGKVTGGAATAADVGMAMLALRDDALSALAQEEGQYTHLRVNAEGALHVVCVPHGGQMTAHVTETVHATVVGR